MKEYINKKILPCYKEGDYYKMPLWKLMKIFWEYMYESWKSFPFDGIFFLESNDNSPKWAKKVHGKMDQMLLEVLK